MLGDLISRADRPPLSETRRKSKITGLQIFSSVCCQFLCLKIFRVLGSSFFNSINKIDTFLLINHTFFLHRQLHLLSTTRSTIFLVFGHSERLIGLAILKSASIGSPRQHYFKVPQKPLFIALQNETLSSFCNVRYLKGIFTIQVKGKIVFISARFMPEPNLPPLVLDPAMVEEIRTNLPRLPAQTRQFLQVYEKA